LTSEPERPAKRVRSAVSAALVAPILFYRRFISPLFPPSCRFQPTCSQYALDAIRIHGPLKGLALAMRRLVRCHPITWLGGSSGFDPVPPKSV
jgi:putative membrane protein insertion efficiency factor